MTKPREKTREELQAEIEGGGKKKMRQFENRENEIAEVEGVDPSRVRDSIRRGLKQLVKYF